MNVIQYKEIKNINHIAVDNKILEYINKMIDNIENKY